MPKNKLFGLLLEERAARSNFADGVKARKSSGRSGKGAYQKRCLALFLAVLLVILCGCVRQEDQLSPDHTPDSTGSFEPEGGETPETSPESTLDHTAIQAMIDSTSEKYGAVGVQVAIVRNGKVVGTYAYGWATMDSDPMTPDHKIRVASISKVVIGITTMLLQEEGIIDIDADMGDYWGTNVRNSLYPDTPITIRSILTHTSSLLSYGEDVRTDHNSIRNRLTSCYRASKPGSIDGWQYNNYSFRMLGTTLEIAADQRIDDILLKKLFSPMGIDASFASGDIQNTGKLAALYQEDDEITKTTEMLRDVHLSNIPGGDGLQFAGGLTISATDLAKILVLLAADGVYEGQQLLDAASVALMEEYVPQPLPDGSYQAQPLCYASQLYARSGIYFHTGSKYGVYNCISYDPNTGDGVVVLTTGASGAVDQYGIYRICNEINAYIYGVLDAPVQ